MGSMPHVTTRPKSQRDINPIRRSRLRQYRENVSTISELPFEPIYDLPQRNPSWLSSRPVTTIRPNINPATPMSDSIYASTGISLCGPSEDENESYDWNYVTGAPLVNESDTRPGYSFAKGYENSRTSPSRGRSGNFRHVRLADGSKVMLPVRTTSSVKRDCECALQVTTRLPIGAMYDEDLGAGRPAPAPTEATFLDVVSLGSRPRSILTQSKDEPPEKTLDIDIMDASPPIVRSVEYEKLVRSHSLPSARSSQNVVKLESWRAPVYKSKTPLMAKIAKEREHRAATSSAAVREVFDMMKNNSSLEQRRAISSARVADILPLSDTDVRSGSLFVIEQNFRKKKQQLFEKIQSVISPELFTKVSRDSEAFLPPE